jgi:putative flippase GtrA
MKSSSWIRWLKFNAVGGIGILVQLGSLVFLRSYLALNYLLATALAVEITILHNFFWHERFTWSDRKSAARLQRLAKFNLSNGAISLVGNVAIMKLLVGTLEMDYFVANVLSIAVCSTANFLVADRAVFVFQNSARAAD